MILNIIMNLESYSSNAKSLHFIKILQWKSMTEATRHDFGLPQLILRSSDWACITYKELQEEGPRYIKRKGVACDMMWCDMINGPGNEDIPIALTTILYNQPEGIWDCHLLPSLWLIVPWGMEPNTVTSHKVSFWKISLSTVSQS